MTENSRTLAVTLTGAVIGVVQETESLVHRILVPPGIAGRIRDENVRRHYAQEFRERVQSFFGNVRPGQGRGGACRQ